MATTFLTLVNDTLRRLNEVELTATDFPNACNKFFNTGNISEGI
jgi:hypothetical protein